jgi:hypothetical protein
MDLVWVFQAALLLGLLRMLVHSLSIAAQPVADGRIVIALIIPSGHLAGGTVSGVRLLSILPPLNSSISLLHLGLCNEYGISFVSHQLRGDKEYAIYRLVTMSLVMNSAARSLRGSDRRWSLL